ncbi:hypothetical protein D3C84_1074670 [compost metagenome]
MSGADNLPSALTSRRLPGRSVTSMFLPSGRNASAQGCSSPVTTGVTSRVPSSLFIVWLDAASTGTVAVIKTLAQRVANKCLCNMQDSFLLT